MRLSLRLTGLVVGALALVVLLSSTVFAASPSAAAPAAPINTAKVTTVLSREQQVLDRFAALRPKLVARIAAIPAGPKQVRAQARLTAFDRQVGLAKAAHDRLATLAVGGIGAGERGPARRDALDFRLAALQARVDALTIRLL